MYIEGELAEKQNRKLKEKDIFACTYSEVYNALFIVIYYDVS
jgi:hypothetical protein